MGRMYVLNHTGHEELTWDTADPGSVAVAEKRFVSLKTKGYSAFVRVAPEGPAVLRIADFEPEADEILWIRPLAGG